MVEHDDFSRKTDVDIEIIDFVATVNQDVRVEIYWEGKIEGKFYRDAKFDVVAGKVDLELDNLDIGGNT